MTRTVTFIFDQAAVSAQLYSCLTADALWEQLPLSGEVHVWGEEIYFMIPVHVPLDETAADTVAVGDIGYWPDGAALCIFFGKTPVSTDDEIKPAGPVNVFGKISGSTDALHAVCEGTAVAVKKAENG